MRTSWSISRPSPVLLALLIAASCVRCGGGSRQAPDSSSAGSPPAEPPLPYCRRVGSTVTICADEKDRASVEGATAQDGPVTIRP